MADNDTMPPSRSALGGAAPAVAAPISLPTTASEPSAQPAPQSSWSFPLSFWTANVIELCERAAYYGWFILVTVYLTSSVGYSDIQAGYITGCFAALLYLLPFVSGAIADRVGYRQALMLALLLLTVGYAGLGLFPLKHLVLIPMALVMFGGALVKPIITGTVARSSTAEHRARAFSLFYMMVNIGSFLGKGAAEPIRKTVGVAMIPLLSATVTAVGFFCVALFYRPADVHEPGSEAQTSVSAAALKLLRDLTQVLRSGRLMAIVLITAGFWIVQGQMYSSMPKYVFRVVGEHASPERYANVNPITVMLAVVPITWLCKKLSPISSIAIALGMIPLSALCMALLPGVLPPTLPIHPVALAMVMGIALQGLSECFLSPRYLEYASRQAPTGKEALYMGYSHLNSFFAWMIGSIMSGYLLDAFCPDPKKLSAADQALHALAVRGQGPLPTAYAHAHYLWFTFFGIGVCAFLAFLVFALLTRERASR
jgi:dipeptide/tripeptide permease